MLLPLLPLPRAYVCLALASLSLATAARGDAVTLRFYPPAGAVAGYKVYVAPATTGAITAAPIDAGARAPDATGVASYSLSGLDPALAYSVELTAYDARKVESGRSNRLTIAPRVETLGRVLWSSSFDQYAPGVHPLGWADERGDTRTSSASDLFAVAYFPDGNAAFGTAADSGMVDSRYLGLGSQYWTSYEISGRVWTSGVSAGAGIDGHATDGGRYFELGQVAGGAWGIRSSNEPALTCKIGPAVGVTQPAGTWYSVRLRVTRASDLTRLRAKVWRPGTAEPAAWQGDCWTTLAASADSGAIALRRRGNGGAYFDDVTVTEVTGKLDPIPPP